MKSRILVTLFLLIPFSAFAIRSSEVSEKKAQLEIHALNSRIHVFNNEPVNLNYRKENPAFQSFLQRYGANWDVAVDTATKRPTLIQGQGIPFVPEVGNSLTFADIQIVSDSGKDVDIKVIEGRARSFIANNYGLFDLNTRYLRMNPASSGIFDDGKIIYVDFNYYYKGILVEGARVFFRINNGNLIQFGSEYIHKPKASITPTVSSEGALGVLLSHFGKNSSEISTLIDKGSLIFLPEQVEMGYNYRLVWDITLRFIDDIATWRGSVDAKSGEILRLYDANRHAVADGGIYPRTVTDGEVIRPFANLRVVNGSNKCTDANGIYTYSGGSSTSGLNGCNVNTYCAVCSNPTQPNAKSDGLGNIHFGTGGTDAVGNGTSTKADRNAFYHANVARTLAKRYITNRSWLNNKNLNANVNGLTPYGACDAWYDGVINFLRSGDNPYIPGGCNNMGEISDVVQHEWGHGLDANDGRALDSTNGSMSEAVADIVAFHVSRDRCIGPGTYRTVNPGPPIATTTPACPTSIRDLAYGPVTPSNLGVFCTTPGNEGSEYGYEIHCESHILSGAIYDLKNLLVSVLGTTAGWNRSEMLFFLTLSQASHMKPTNSSPWYNAVLAVDDDNGNLADGTPNGCRIYQAFNAHGIASGAPVACSGNIPPTVSITSPVSGSVFTAPANITITANASDSDGTITKVEFFSNSVLLGSDTTSPYSFAWSNVPAGNYSLTARATDNLGLTGTSAQVPITVNPPTQSPYLGIPFAVPGLIQAEHFDNGGEGIAYHDADAGNLGGQYRSTGVDITVTADTGGGYIVGWTNAGEWLEYTVNVSTAGTYKLEARVASAISGSSFHVEFNGALAGTIAVPYTGGWDTWQTLRTNINLSAGQQIMRVAVDTGGFNLNHIRIAQYQGHLDAADCQYIAGWAWDRGQPNTPINVDILSDGLNSTIPANAFRQDLLNAGIGNGYHAFAFPVPANLKNGQPHSISVKYSGTNDQLTGSPKTITCSGPSISIMWIKPAEKSWGPPGSLTAAGYALNGSGTVQLVWRNATINGPWNVVGYQATPGPGGDWSNSIPAPTNKCHVYQAYANYNGVSSPVFTYDGVAAGDCTETARVIWIQPQPLAGFGPPGSLVVAGEARNAPAGYTVQMFWRNLTINGPWNTEPYQPVPDANGIWYHSIPNANYFQQYAVYVRYDAITSGTCNYAGNNNITWCP